MPTEVNKIFKHRQFEILSITSSNLNETQNVQTTHSVPSTSTFLILPRGIITTAKMWIVVLYFLTSSCLVDAKLCLHQEQATKIQNYGWFLPLHHTLHVKETSEKLRNSLHPWALMVEILIMTPLDFQSPGYANRFLQYERHFQISNNLSKRWTVA